MFLVLREGDKTKEVVKSNPDHIPDPRQGVQRIFSIVAKKKPVKRFGYLYMCPGLCYVSEAVL